ncbi:GNAT family N-acetyltransferase [uncultured Phenylobacterium sp.]|uniref:GNAT family N-acetyltransferase n=1 Tax=uncultured Phenylobacterium sp. TaxID=349273 RepID=UPI0025F966FA|nr:GNAT family N-acetyltransferase [uncultured Phenylobacterium sp.]
MDAPLRLPDVLADETIRLDAYRVADAEVHAAAEDREMRLRFDAPDPDVAAPLDHVRDVMRGWIAARAAGRPNIVYAIREAGGALAGGCELRWLDSESLNVSYWIYPAFRGSGLAARAVALLCEAARGEHARRLEAHIDADNTGSRRTAAAAGFTEAGTVHDEGPDGAPRMRLRYVRPLPG